MTIQKSTNIVAKESDLEVRMGSSLTTIAFKGVDKMTITTKEVDILIWLLNNAKESLVVTETREIVKV